MVCIFPSSPHFIDRKIIRHKTSSSQRWMCVWLFSTPWTIARLLVQSYAASNDDCRARIPGIKSPNSCLFDYTKHPLLSVFSKILSISMAPLCSSDSNLLNYFLRVLCRRIGRLKDKRGKWEAWENLSRLKCFIRVTSLRTISSTFSYKYGCIWSLCYFENYVS